MRSGIVVLLMLITSSLWAQSSGSISGKIADKTTKQALEDAVVVVAGTSLGTTTDAQGRFLIENVAENIYKLEVHFVGYDSFLETDVRVVRGKTTYVEEIELIQSVLEGEETVVAAGYFREDAQAPVSSFTYTRDEIRRTPGATGDIFRAMETLPGVSTSGGEFAAFSVRGGSPEENIILIDNIPFSSPAIPTLETYPVDYGIQYYAIAVLFAVATTYFAGWFPARKASSVDPVEIIRGK